MLQNQVNLTLIYHALMFDCLLKEVRSFSYVNILDLRVFYEFFFSYSGLRIAEVLVSRS